MANKRMFALCIVDTDKFLEMPMSSRYLYYELGMRGDDDGFVSNPRKILRITGCRTDDLKKLAEEGYIRIFDSGILVITDWHANNYIRSDRYQPTRHKAEYELYYGIPLGIPNGIPSGSIEQTRIDKISKEQQQKTEQIIGKYGVRKTVDTLRKEGSEEEAIVRALLLLASAKKVRNPGAWLRRAVEENWTDAEAERKEAMRRENEAITAVAREAMEKERLETEREPINDDFFEKALKRHNE